MWAPSSFFSRATSLAFGGRVITDQRERATVSPPPLGRVLQVSPGTPCRAVRVAQQRKDMLSDSICRGFRFALALFYSAAMLQHQRPNAPSCPFPSSPICRPASPVHFSHHTSSTPPHQWLPANPKRLCLWSRKTGQRGSFCTAGLQPPSHAALCLPANASDSEPAVPASAAPPLSCISALLHKASVLGARHACEQHRLPQVSLWAAHDDGVPDRVYLRFLRSCVSSYPRHSRFSCTN